jgi:hypothetical protein
MSKISNPIRRLEQDGRQPCAPRHRSVAVVELITTAALALSTAVAATAVSIGMARADVVATPNAGGSTALAVGVVIALLLALPALALITTPEQQTEANS